MESSLKTVRSTPSIGSVLTNYWNRIVGTNVILDDATYVNPALTAPTSKTQIDPTFQLTVYNEAGTTSKPDYVTVTFDPILIVPPPPSNEDPQTVYGIIKENINSIVLLSR